MTRGDASNFFVRLNAAAESAAAEVDRQYRERLKLLVQREMGRRFAGREGAEDPVQSALASFFRGVREKRFSIDSSAALWRLLETITRHKIAHHIEHHTTKGRDPRREQPLADGFAPAAEPDPAEAAAVADLIAQVITGLAPPGPEIFRLRLEGHTRAEIAARLGCTEAAVRVTLDRIRDRLRRLQGDGPP